MMNIALVNHHKQGKLLGPKLNLEKHTKQYLEDVYWTESYMTVILESARQLVPEIAERDGCSTGERSTCVTEHVQVVENCCWLPSW
jgi:hypothetical protein